MIALEFAEYPHGDTMSLEPAPGIYEGSLGQDNVLFSAVDRRLHVLNGTAFSVWRSVIPGMSVADVVAAITDEYGIVETDIGPEVRSVLRTFLNAGLCQPVEDTRRFESRRSKGPTAGSPVRTQQSSNAGEIVRRSTQELASIGPLVALGVPVSVSTEDTFLHLELSRILGPLMGPDLTTPVPNTARPLQQLDITSTDGVWCVRRNGAVAAKVTSRAAVIRAVVAECNSAPLPHIDDAVVFHAAAADLGGGIVLFPGVSNAGKSTLVTQLLLRGHAYLTDEAVAVELASLQARPYPKSITIEAGSQAVLASALGRKLEASVADGRGSGTWDVDPRSVGPGRLSSAGTISAVVFPTYAPETAPELRPLDRISALRLLLENAFSFDHVGQGAFDALIRIANMLPCYSMVHHGDGAHLEQLEVMFSGSRAVSL